MKYDEVLHSANHEVFEIRGSAVVCQSENQFLTASGQRLNTGKSEPVNLSFAANFTKHFAELAAQDPVFADMNGVFDLALVAALIRHEGLDQRLAWNRGVFAADGAYQPRTFDAPRECESVVNHKVYNGKDVVIQVAGGVRADLAGVLKSGKTLKEETRLNSRPKVKLPEGRWWWDAE